MDHREQQIAALIREHMPVQDANGWECEGPRTLTHFDTFAEWAQHLAHVLAVQLSEERPSLPPDAHLKDGTHEKACVAAVGEVAHRLGLEIVNGASEVRPASMSYVKPSELADRVRGADSVAAPEETKHE